MKTEWRDVPGWEGIYEVSNDGRVRRLTEKKPTMLNTGYLYVGLYDKPRKEMKSVHRIVAETFIPNPDGKTEVNHINGDKTDNRIENLEWVTPKENTNHAIANGLKIRGVGGAFEKKEGENNGEKTG